MACAPLKASLSLWKATHDKPLFVPDSKTVNPETAGPETALEALLDLQETIHSYYPDDKHLCL